MGVKPQMRIMIVAIALAATAALPLAADTVTPPQLAENPPLPAASSVGTTDILISTLAVLLIWAAAQQNARAKSDS